MQNYKLPNLSYSLDGLSPFLSSEQLEIHYQKHHKSYVDGANKILEEMDNARKSEKIFNQKRVLKDFSFNIGGHILHSLFWKNLSSKEKKTGKETMKLLKKGFKSYNLFKEEFSQAALSVEGSGWAALMICRETGNPMICQIEKHNTNFYPLFEILMVLDVFEHAYYIDYKNNRSSYINNFWKAIDWEKVEKRLLRFNKLK